MLSMTFLDPGAFLVTNPTDESNSSRLAVIRKQFGHAPLLLVFVAVVMVTTGQEIIENKIAHIITQSLASILVEAEMLTG